MSCHTKSFFGLFLLSKKEAGYQASFIDDSSLSRVQVYKIAKMPCQIGLTIFMLILTKT